MTRQARCSLALLSALLPALGWSASLDRQRTSDGVVIEKVDAGFALAQAGLRPGDVVRAWTSADTIRGRRAGAAIRSPSELSLTETEYGLRPGFSLIVQRDGAQLEIDIPPRPWSTRVRPQLAEPDRQLHARAVAAMAESRWDQAARSFETLAESRRRTARLDDAVWYLEQAAAARRSQHRFELAEQLTNRAVHLAQEAGQDMLVAWVLQTAGEDLRLKGPRADARRRLVAALRIRVARAPGSLATAETLLSLTKVVRDSDFDQAQRYARRALGIAHARSPGSLVEAEAHQQLGSTLFQSDDLESALAHTRAALEIRSRLDAGGPLEARSLGALANIHRRRGELDLAQQYYERALATFHRDEPGGWLEAGTLRNLGALAAERRDLAAAERHDWAALAIYEKLAPEAIDVAGARNTLGLIYRRRGDLRAARSLMEQALGQYRRLAPGGQSELVVLVNLAEVALEQHDLVAAREYLAASAGIIGTFHGRGFDVGTRLLEIGRTELGVEDYAGAERHLTEALASMKRSNTGGIRVAEVLTCLGRLHAATGKATAARDELAHAIEIASRFAPGTLLEAEPLYHRARLEQAAGETQRADELFARALGALESQRMILGGSDEERANFSEKVAAYYGDYIELLVSLGRAEQAFDVSERYRARVLLETFFSRHELVTATLPESLARDHERAVHLYEQAFDRVRTFDAAKEKPRTLEQAVQALQRARLERNVLDDRVLAMSSRRPASNLTRPHTAAEVASQLPSDTVLLSYVATTGRVHLFVLGRAADSSAGDRMVVHRVLKSDPGRLREEIAALTIQMRAHADTPDAQRALLARLASLHETLIAPVASLLNGKRRLVIVSDGALHRVPWAALTKRASQPRYLIEDFRIVVAPSATFHIEASRNMRPGTVPIARVVALAGDATVRDPRASGALPSAVAEVDTIKAIFGPAATVLSGPAATEGAAKRIMTSADVLHFAAHAVADESSPLDSYIALAAGHGARTENGSLQAWEVMAQLRLRSRIVVLSACDTAIGRETPGEGLLGLTRAFHYAGAPSVVASLWPVADTASAALMKHFYTRVAANDSADQSLRVAQLALLEGKERSWLSRLLAPMPYEPRRAWQHPFFWASFQVSGTGR